jgi:hypothetical protein
LPIRPAGLGEGASIGGGNGQNVCPGQELGRHTNGDRCGVIRSLANLRPIDIGGVAVVRRHKQRGVGERRIRTLTTTLLRKYRVATGADEAGLPSGYQIHEHPVRLKLELLTGETSQPPCQSL